MTAPPLRPTKHLQRGLARVAIAFAAILCAANVSRGEPLSRGGAIARALRQNPQVAAARAAEAQASARRDQAQAARWPTVSLTLGTGPSLKARLVPGSAVESTENTYGDVGLDDLSIVLGGQLEVLQPIYTFGKIGHRERAAEHEIRARRAQTEMTRAQLAVTVAQVYEGLLFARAAESFFLEMERWLARTIEDTREELTAASDLTEQDLLRLQTAMAALQISIHQAQAARRQAEAGLVAYLALPSGATIEPKEPGLELLPSAPDDRTKLVELALDQRPELRALSEGSAAYEALARAESAGNLPDFFALAFASGAYTPGRDAVQTRYVQDSLHGFYPGLLVGARWQFTGSMASDRAEENQAMARELAHTRRWAEMGLPAEVTRAFEDARRARKDADEAEKAVGLAKQWVVRASADFAIGLGDAREVTDASSAYVQLRVASFDARFRHNVALAELARATGTFNGVDRSPFYPIREK
jgi:outer membrane protein TolC